MIGIYAYKLHKFAFKKLSENCRMNTLLEQLEFTASYHKMVLRYFNDVQKFRKENFFCC